MNFVQRIIVFILVFIHITFITNGQFKVTIIIEKFPATSNPLFLAGSFNNWNPADKNFIFKKDPNGRASITIPLQPGTYEFKITQGTWENSECTQNGTPVQNHIIKVNEDVIMPIEIHAWTSFYPKAEVASTASPQVTLLKKKFYIPALKRSKKIWIYLPKNYSTSNKRYPVLYMHDGQNVFDKKTSYSGEWGIDEFMDSTSLPQSIVVAINNDPLKRLNEYNPYDNIKYGKGEGRKYIDFIVTTLKPWVDKTYRTKKDKENTFIAGSSMGGLISLYALLYKPHVFGGAGIFSPAFWISGEKIYSDIKKMGHRVNSHIYFFAGKLENDAMVPDMLKAFNTMQQNSKSNMITVIRNEGQHNEATWQHEFPFFYQWLLKKTLPVN